MAVFAYKAVDGAMAVIQGTIAADTPRQARDTLRDQGLSVETIEALADAGSRGWSAWLPSRGRSQGHRLVGFLSDLSTLIGVGIPVVDALATVEKQHRGSFKSMILQLRERISAGQGLAEAMKSHPRVFDAFAIAITEVGEYAGNLDEALQRLAEFKQRAAQLRGRIGNALLYPAVVLCMAIGVSLFLMSYVVPTLLDGLLEAGRPVPLVTRIVKSISDVLIHQWWLLLLVGLGLVVAVSLVLRTTWGRWFWHRVLLGMPLLGELIRKQAVGRVAIVVSTLMRSGIGFVDAVRIAAGSTQNLVLRRALGRCETAVAAGQDIGEALESTRVFPPTVVQVFSVGQQSGRLEDMLDRLANDYDNQVSVATQRLTAVLEPALIVLMVFLVGVIAFSVILPILEAGKVL